MAFFTLYIIAGIAPSFIWLLFYLQKDRHPEPNRMIIKVFLYGMISAVIAAAVEIMISNGIDAVSGVEGTVNYSFLIFVLYNFLGIALVEEIAKFFVVKKIVLKNKEFDEPVDAMLYMIISALGFAALENILILAPMGNSLLLSQIITKTLSTSAIRFVGATFLHALASGTVGYFLALSICYQKRRKFLVTTGILIASLLHGFYNFSIIEMFETQNTSFVFIPVIILVTLLIFVLWGFGKLNKIKSICKIN